MSTWWEDKTWITGITSIGKHVIRGASVTFLTSTIANSEFCAQIEPRWANQVWFRDFWNSAFALIMHKYYYQLPGAQYEPTWAPDNIFQSVSYARRPRSFNPEPRAKTNPECRIWAYMSWVCYVAGLGSICALYANSLGLSFLSGSGNPSNIWLWK